MATNTNHSKEKEMEEFMTNLSKQNPVKLQEYLTNFNLFDQDGDGKIAVTDLGAIFSKIGKKPTDTELKDLINEYDTDNNGTIEFNEFVAMTEKMNSSQDDEKDLRAAFDVFDKDGSHFIDKEELKEILKTLGENLTDSQVNEMMKQADKDGDGLVSYEEFKLMMKQ